MKTNNFFMPALALIALLLPLTSSLLDPRFAWVLFLVVVLVSRFFVGHQKITMQCVDVVFYASVLLLTFYFVDTGVSRGMFPLFDGLSDKITFTDMLALWVMLEVTLRYMYSDTVTMDLLSITAGVIAELTLVINGRWSAQFVMLVLALGVASIVVPVAEQIKRALQLFFGSAFILCNISLLIYYTGWLHVNTMSYSIEKSIVGELGLSMLALYILREWDKIPKGTPINRVRMFGLQSKIRRGIKIAICAIAVMVVLGCDMGIGSSTKVAFLTQEGVLTNTIVSLLYQVYEAVQAALNYNLIGISFATFGFSGAIVAMGFVGGSIYLLYRAMQHQSSEKKRLIAIALFEVIQLLVLPVAWELLVLYMLFLYGAVSENGILCDTIKIFFKKQKITPPQ